MYLTATGGNPGLTAGTNNAAIVMIAAITDCNTLKNNAATTFVFVDEVTTIGSLAALYPYASSSGALSATSGQVTAFNTAFRRCRSIRTRRAGSAPGPSLPGGYYASSTEINTLGDIARRRALTRRPELNCSTLFNLTKSGSVAPTNIAGAIVNILNNPTQNTAPLFGLGGAVVPFQPELGVAPTSWSLPILPIAATPTFSVAAGTYGAAQFVTLSDTTSGAVIHYTIDGSTPTSASPIYNGTAITVSSSETINAIAQAGGFATSAVATAGYTITGSTTTYSVNGQVILSNSCGVLCPRRRFAQPWQRGRPDHDDKWRREFLVLGGSQRDVYGYAVDLRSEFGVLSHDANCDCEWGQYQRHQLQCEPGVYRVGTVAYNGSSLGRFI